MSYGKKKLDEMNKLVKVITINRKNTEREAFFSCLT